MHRFSIDKFSIHAKNEGVNCNLQIGEWGIVRGIESYKWYDRGTCKWFTIRHWTSNREFKEYASRISKGIW